MSIETKIFGKTKDGQQAHLYTLTNNNGLSAGITDYGAKLVNLNIPDNKGNKDDIVLGFDNVEGYQSDRDQKFGATIGPVAGRIGGAKFTLNKKTHKLNDNKGNVTLHSGDKDTLQEVIWQANKQENKNSTQLVLTCKSYDGQAGFPGNVEFKLTYTLTNDNSLVLKYEATTDAPTPICLTNHSYFNLAGHGETEQTLKNHRLQLNASRYTPWGKDSLPSGQIETVKDTYLDFKKPKTIGKDIKEANEQATNGYDHYFILDKPENEMSLAARVFEPDSARLMEVFTDQPGLVFYSANNLKNQKGKSNKTYPAQSALCLETQGYPGALNNPQFPSIILNPKEKYIQNTIYRFSIVPK